MRRAARDLSGYLLREWLLLLSVTGLVVSIVLTRRWPRFTANDLEVLAILAALLAAVKGLETSGVVGRLSRLVAGGRLLHVRLVVVTFFLAMFLTNDVVLVLVVPVTLALAVPRRDLLVVLEALAANAGSALTPFGNPQNLLIYWSYGLAPGTFLAAIAPFSLAFLVLLAVAAAVIGRGTAPLRPLHVTGGEETVARWDAAVHVALLLLVVLVVLRRVPLWALAAVPLHAALRDRSCLRIDYALLLILFCFFGIADDVQAVLGPRLEHAGHIFLTSALASQVVSNVPAALMFSHVTDRWPALLWGVNVGGFGGLVASLANLIAYRLYVARPGADDVPRFTLRFVLAGSVAFFLGMGLFFLVRPGA